MLRSAPLRGMGKASLPDRILLELGKLRPGEFEIMKTRTALGYEALERAQSRCGKRAPLLELSHERAAGADSWPTPRRGPMRRASPGIARAFAAWACAGWAAIASGIASGIASAAGAAPYPDRPIHVVIPFGVGSTTDYHARNLATHAGTHLGGASLVLENQVGDAGAQAVLSVKAAAPDGYKLLVARPANLAVMPAQVRDIPYRWTDFSFIGLLELDPLVCAVRADSPYRTARDLLGAIRRSPGTLKYSHSGLGTLTDLSSRLLMSLHGLKAGYAKAVAFPGGGQDAADALLQGRVDFTCNNAGAMIGPIRDGRLRGLLTTAPGRLELLPQVPNAQEAGLRDMAGMLGWSALVGPRGLPEPVVARWRQALERLSRDPDWRARTIAYGAIPALGTSKDNAAYIKEQAEFYERVVRKLGAGR